MYGIMKRCGLALLFVTVAASSCPAQEINIGNALQEAEQSFVELKRIPTSNWWDQYATEAIDTESAAVPLDVNQLLFLALKNSAQVQVYSEVPLIRETAINEAVAAFDWTKFAEALWRDVSEPVGSSLTVGGTGDRFLEEQFTSSVGLRRRTRSGGQFEVSQQIGWQDTNSSFFIPDNQGTSRLTLGFTQPLLRGRGRSYNESLIVLAKIDVETANQEFKRQLQSHLMEVVRGYWALYLERGSLAQKVGLYEQTKGVFNQLQARKRIDAGQTQLASAAAALENRRADLIRSRAAVANAETRLRALINASSLNEPTEFIPTQPPSFDLHDADTLSEVETAVQHRPEIASALKEIKAGCVRLKMAEHEMLPQLNLITQTYVAGLQGDSDIGQAIVDQFSDGAPSYSAGLQFEVPIGRRAANARLTRRLIEARQLQQQYRTALENVKAEIEIAVRELHTSYREMFAKFRSMESARNEAITIEARWKRNADGGTSSLNLDALLRAQERVTDAEFEYLSAQLTYNLSLMNLRRANGTLLQTENVQIDKRRLKGVPKFELNKFDSFEGGDVVNEVYEGVIETPSPGLNQ